MRDPLANLPGYVLRRASNAVLGGLHQRLALLELRPVDASLLMILHAKPGITQSEAGRLLEIQRANMVPIVARLEARELIERRRVDGRSQGLYLSPQGEGLHADVRAQVQQHEDGLLAAIEPGLRAQVLPVLHALWSAAEKLA